MNSPRTTSRPRLEGLEARDVPAFVNPISTAGEYSLTADMNGDGKADLVKLDTATSKVHVRLGNGDGTFQAALSSKAGSGTTSVLAGDFNGDGKLDLVTRNGSTCYWLQGSGNGRFQSPRSFTLPKVGTSAQTFGQAVTSDVNNDGHLDLMIAGYTVTSHPRVGNITKTYLNVLLGDGGGSFAAQAPRHVWQNIGTPPLVKLFPGDFNGDGEADVLGVYLNRGANVLMGNGDGTFGEAITVSGLANSLVLAVGDVNLDGRADIVRADNLGTVVSVRVSNGDGTFAAPVDHAVGAGVQSVALADLNRDGRLDLVAFRTGTAGADGISVLLGSGGGSFSPAQVVAGLPTDFGSAGLADFDGDGWADLALNRTDGQTAIYFNDRLW